MKKELSNTSDAQPVKPAKQERNERRPYQAPKVESVKLTPEAAEALT